MNVHNSLRGTNFTKIIFRRALLKELSEACSQFESEMKLAVDYKEEIIGKKRINILVE